jgi:cytochrome bd-type quinol oxidase subunit 2
LSTGGAFGQLRGSLQNCEKVASNRETLWIMSVIAAIAVPLVATYTAIVSWTFRGKAQADGD